MSKYLIVGDIHCKLDNLNKVNQVFDLVESYNLPTIWLGDLLDSKAIIRAECLSLLYRYFKASKIQHVILIGNHDLISLTSIDHSLETLKSLPNVTIIDQPTVIDGIAYCPYIHSAEELRKAVKGLKTDVLFAHLDLTGHDMGQGHISEAGVKLADLKHFKTVISGHWHGNVKYGNVEYLGTPFSLSFGESNQTKYLGIFDSETLELELISTTGYFPRHITVEVDLDKNTEIDVIDNAIFNAGGIQQEDEVRVILKGSEEAVRKFDRSDYNHIKFIEKITEMGSEDLKLTESLDNIVKFTEWAKEKQINQETLSLGLELLKEVT
jgi:predicted phosphodiesterase